jgi:WD40 repeat protein
VIDLADSGEVAGRGSSPRWKAGSTLARGVQTALGVGVTLRQLFDRSKDGSLTLQAYKALGDEAAGLTPLENAVRKAADTVLDEANATNEEKTALREAFVPAMVRVNEQGEYVRRPARMDALPPMSHPLLERLAKARLLIIRQEGDTRLVEVAHEALLRKWPWLKEKLDAERVFLIGKQQLEQDFRDWQAAADKDKTDALLTGLKLTRARVWLVEHPTRLTAEERAFVQASIERDEAQKRSRERTRRTVIGVLGLMVVGLAIVAGWAYHAQGVATENAARAQKAFSDATLANSRAAQVQQIARQTGDPSLGPQLSLLLAVHAATLQTNDGVGLLGAMDGIRQQLRAAPGLPLDGHAADVVAAAYSPDRHWLATGGADGLVRLHDLTATDPRSAAHDLAGHHGPVAGLVFAADGRLLLSAGSDGTLRSWKVDTASPVAGRVIAVNGVGPIRALSASPNGQWLVFGTESGELCLWHWQPDGPEEAPCDPAWRDEAPVTTVMFSPKGRWLATTCTGACKGFDAPVRLWDLSLQGAERGPKSLVRKSALTEPSLLAIAFSADETRLAAAYGYVAELWDLTQPDPSASPVGTYPSGGGWITTLDISADGRWLALGSGGSNDVRLWRLSGDRGEARAPTILSGHGGPVTVLRFGGDGRWLASAAADGSLNLWDLAQPVLRATPLRGHDLSIKALRFSPEDEPSHLLSWGEGESARLWHLPDASADPLVLRAPVGPLLMGMAISADGRWIASSSQDDNQLALWSIQDPRAPTHLLAMPGFARSIAFSPDGRWLAAKSQDRGRISLWSLRDLAKPPRVMVQEGWSDDRTLRFSPDSHWLASGSYGGQGQRPSLDFWDVSTDTPALQPRYRCRPTSPVRELVFSDDAKLLATAAQDRAAYLWNLGSENPCSSPMALPHGDVVYEMSLSRDARWAATASMDQKGRLWELTPGAPPKLVREIDFEDRVMRAVFSPDNRWVAFASWDHSAALLDLRAPATSAAVRLRGHVGRILAAAFSPDGQWLATAGEDRTIRLWRPDAAGAAPIVLRGHEGSVPHLGFSPDGSWLVSGAYDGTVRLWRLRLNDLIQTACAIAGRTLTPAEIQQYLGGASATPCAAQGK